MGDKRWQTSDGEWRGTAERERSASSVALCPRIGLHRFHGRPAQQARTHLVPIGHCVDSISVQRGGNAGDIAHTGAGLGLQTRQHRRRIAHGRLLEVHEEAQAGRVSAQGLIAKRERWRGNRRRGQWAASRQTQGQGPHRQQPAAGVASRNGKWSWHGGYGDACADIMRQPLAPAQWPTPRLALLRFQSCGFRAERSRACAVP